MPAPESTSGESTDPPSSSSEPSPSPSNAPSPNSEPQATPPPVPRNPFMGKKVKNVFHDAPDVDVDVFRTQIERFGSPKPRFALFVSQDDGALSVSKAIWGGEQRLGNIDPAIEPYRSTLAQEQVVVFDLTKLKGNAHSRAFDDITEVMLMIRERLN